MEGFVDIGLLVFSIIIVVGDDVTEGMIAGADDEGTPGVD
jgi:hypothetical protein